MMLGDPLYSVAITLELVHLVGACITASVFTGTCIWITKEPARCQLALPFAIANRRHRQLTPTDYLHIYMKVDSAKLIIIGCNEKRTPDFTIHDTSGSKLGPNVKDLLVQLK
jgi:hypothetical protein